MPEQFKKLIANAKRIIITSHIGPDPDAVSSSLLLAETIRKNYPGIEVHHVLEEVPNSDLSFLAGYSNIEFTPILAALATIKPDVLIIADANNFGRISRNESEQVRELVAKQHVKTIVIDHHEEANKDDVDLFLNEHGPAAVQEVYRLCFTQLGLEKPADYAQITMLGLLSDSGRFKYHNAQYRETFQLVGDLIEAGASIEVLEDKLERYTENELAVIGELAANITHDTNYSYSFIRDRFTKNWKVAGKSIQELKNATGVFVDRFIRNMDDRWWGFIIYPDLTKENGYSASFRSVKGVQDVSVVAGQFGGGGHQPAAGAKFEAKSVDEAIEKVKLAIKQVQ